MVTQRNWDETNLPEYLLYDYWHPNKALWILVGFFKLDYDSLDDLEGFTEKESSEYARLLSFWNTRHISASLRSFYNDPHTPVPRLIWV